MELKKGISFIFFDSGLPKSREHRARIISHVVAVMGLIMSFTVTVSTASNLIFKGWKEVYSVIISPIFLSLMLFVSLSILIVAVYFYWQKDNIARANTLSFLKENLDRLYIDQLERSLINPTYKLEKK